MLHNGLQSIDRREHLGATQDVQGVMITRTSDVSLWSHFLIGMASSVVAGIIVWYAFEKR